ncbi:MAG TPA: hypothetical protein VM889_01150 [Candidatus Thermoplasmatota archaeon]|nr:hypothetical protein [Candidatus Thermoplasmatota archaeon]
MARVVPTLLVVAALLLAGCVARPQAGDPPGATTGGNGPPAFGDPFAGWPSPRRDRPVEPPTPPEGVDVHVHVDGTRVLAQLPTRFLATSIADWSPQLFDPTPDPTWVAYLAAMQPAYLRFPAGHSGQDYHWDPTNTVKKAPEGSRWVLSADRLEAFLDLCDAVGAKPLIEVNLKRGTPAMAADMAEWNLANGRRIEWWQLGNEPDYKATSWNRTPESHARDSERFAAAIAEVDPRARFAGPEVMTPAAVTGIRGRADWMTPFLERNGDTVDAVTWHYYPLDSEQTRNSSSATLTRAHLLQERVTDWPPAGLSYVDDAGAYTRVLRDRHAPEAELWVTELGPDSGIKAGKGVGTTHAGALWASDVVGRFARQGFTGIFQFLFSANPGHGLALIDMPSEDVRPMYYAYWLHARHAAGAAVLNATASGDPKVAAHAYRAPDGSVKLLIVNRNDAPVTVGLTSSVRSLPAIATAWWLGASAPDATDTAVNGVRFAEGPVAVDGVPAPLPGGALTLPGATAVWLAL